MRVLRIKPHKAVTGGDGRLRLLAFIIGIGQIQQRLLRVFAERITGLKILIVPDRLAVIARVQRPFRARIEAIRAQVQGVVFLVAAEKTTAGQAKQE